LRASHGATGTCAGVVELLERERERRPAIWLDVGDLVVGSPAYPLLGERPWPEVAGLPIAAAAAGNHDFDDGVDALLAAARSLSFPLLCASVDVDLPGAVTVPTEAGPVGVIGLTHPACHELSRAPAPAADWPERVAAAARALRDGGARWVVALLHDGVEWWPDSAAGSGAIRTRSRRLEELARPWAAGADLVLAGHNFGTWVGALAGTPAAEPHLFASSVAVVDFAPRPVVRGVFRAPAVEPARRSAAVEAVEDAAARVVGELGQRWLTRTGAPRYLPDLLARAFRDGTGADAGFAMPSFHGTQAPFDGAIAALGPGPVTELDVIRLVAAPDYDPVIVELRPGELRRAAETYWAIADPRNVAADRLAWNWCRMPAGVSARPGSGDPASVAVIPGAVPRLAEWLGRDVQAAPGGVTARDALIAALD
jgi:2',3'-cyclic-nucleotide 2'-phosphodiesterase (5'-nucleotidase family)